MAKSFLVSPGRAYLVIAGEGTKIVRANGTLIDTVPEGANNISITVDTHEIIVMDNSAKIQQLYNGNSGSSGIMTVADGEDAGSWKVEIVSTLPEVGSPGVIYMLRTNRTGTDRYDDYIWIAADNAYELLGRRPESSTVDLSNVAKTNAANTFTQPQRVQAELYATTLSANAIDCETVLEAGNVSATSALVDYAQIATLQVTRMTVLTELSVDNKASIRLPGMEWRPTDNQNIFVYRDLDMQKAVVHNAIRVSNVLALGDSSEENQIQIDMASRKMSIPAVGGDSSVVLTSEGITATRGTVCVTLAGDSIAIATIPNSDVPVFSISLDTAGAQTDGDLILNDTISIPGTLNVNNLNVTGTVTGINTGSGGTPTLDFSNGVTIMSILTAEDIDAENVVADTLTANNSISVAGTEVISHNGTAIVLNSAEVTTNKLTATTIASQYIQGATFTGPLVMTKDNALEVWGSGAKATLSNGNITGVYYAQMDHCTVTHALSADSAKINRASVTDTLVVKDLVVTGTTTGIQTGGGGSGTIPDPLSVNDLSANVAAFGAVTVTSTLTVPEGVYFSSTIALKKNALYPKKINLLNPDNARDAVTLAAYEVECTVMTVTNFNVMSDFHASKMWCLELGSDHEGQSHPIEVVSPLAATMLNASQFITVDNALSDHPTAFEMSISSPCVALGYRMDGSPVAEFRVHTLRVASPQDSAASTYAPVLEVKAQPAVSGSTPLTSLKINAATFRFGPPNYLPGSPLLVLTHATPGTSSIIELHGPMQHSIENRAYLTTNTGYFIGSSSSATQYPTLYVSNNPWGISDVRALYSTPANGYNVSNSRIPGLFVGDMLYSDSLVTGGLHKNQRQGQLAANVYGAFIRQPLRAIDPVSDMQGLYYKPTSNTLVPNLWQELVAADGRPLSSVTSWEVEDSTFGLLVNTEQHPTTTPSWPIGSYDDKSNVVVSSIEFGFSTGPNGLTITWPSSAIWPDEPDRVPPTQFQPNMCYRFVARLEPIPDPSVSLFSATQITYRYALLLSQTYSYPNPWAIT